MISVVLIALLAVYTLYHTLGIACTMDHKTPWHVAIASSALTAVGGLGLWEVYGFVTDQIPRVSTVSLCLTILSAVIVALPRTPLYRYLHHDHN